MCSALRPPLGAGPHPKGLGQSEGLGDGGDGAEEMNGGLLGGFRVGRREGGRRVKGLGRVGLTLEELLP